MKGSQIWTGVAATVIVAAVIAPRTASAQEPAKPVDLSWANGLLLDQRARQAGDLVTVQITENISASGTADANLDKTSKSDGALPWPLPSKWSQALQASADTKFTGGGATNRTATITATISAKVVERKPNGDLAIVGVREININGDRQFITLSGVIRAVDINQANVVASPMVSDLRIQYAGQGFMKDNLSPGWLVRFLNKIF